MVTIVMAMEDSITAYQDLGLLNHRTWLVLLELVVDALLELNALAEDIDLLVSLPHLHMSEVPLKFAKSITDLHFETLCTNSFFEINFT